MEMNTQDKLVYARTRVVRAKIVNNKADVEIYSRHIRELEEEDERKVYPRQGKKALKGFFAPLQILKGKDR